MAVAVFNSQQFLGRYPEFNAVNAANPERLPALFQEATIYLDNTDTALLQNIATRTILLNMVTAHISYLAGDLSADGQARPVGRMSQATQGSVSASFEDESPTPGSGAWFRQSQYGAAFWRGTANLRSMTYIPAPCCY